MLKLGLLIICIFTIGLSSAHGQVTGLQKFSSDGCSSAPDGILGESIVHCCIAHDFAYWLGGTEGQRQFADENLSSCVKQTLDEVGLVSSVYKMGVVVGGAPKFLSKLNSPFYWRWGYGWGENFGYQNLTIEQLELGLKELRDLDRNFIEVVHAQQNKANYNWRFRGLEISHRQFAEIQIELRFKIRDIEYEIEKKLRE